MECAGKSMSGLVLGGSVGSGASKCAAFGGGGGVKGSEGVRGPKGREIFADVE